MQPSIQPQITYQSQQQNQVPINQINSNISPPPIQGQAIMVYGGQLGIQSQRESVKQTVLLQGAQVLPEYQIIKGESKFEYEPYEQIITEYDQREVKIRIPINKFITEYQVIEHQIEYYPEITYEIVTDYAPNQRIEAEIQYQTQEKRIEHGIKPEMRTSQIIEQLLLLFKQQDNIRQPSYSKQIVASQLPLIQSVQPVVQQPVVQQSVVQQPVIQQQIFQTNQKPITQIPSSQNSQQVVQKQFVSNQQMVGSTIIQSPQHQIQYNNNNQFASNQQLIGSTIKQQPQQLPNYSSQIQQPIVQITSPQQQQIVQSQFVSNQQMVGSTYIQAPQEALINDFSQIEKTNIQYVPMEPWQLGIKYGYFRKSSS